MITLSVELPIDAFREKYPSAYEQVFGKARLLGLA